MFGFNVPFNVHTCSHDCRLTSHIHTAVFPQPKHLHRQRSRLGSICGVSPGTGQDPGICCRMSDPKLPNFGIYVRMIFRRFRPHFRSDLPFGPNSVRTKDRTWCLGKNVRIKHNLAEKSAEQGFLYLFDLTMTLQSLYNNVCHRGMRKFKVSHCS
jgi:hypothetical protein